MINMKMMKATKKYSFKDWWSGNIILIYSKPNYDAKNEAEAPIWVTWDDIIDSDIPKIKEKQKSIFEEEVNKHLPEWKKHFLKRFDKSELPDILLNDELNKFAKIMFGPMQDILENNKDGLYFDNNHISEIKNFMNDKINGASSDFDFVQSRICLYQFDFVRSQNLRMHH